MAANDEIRRLGAEFTLIDPASSAQVNNNAMSVESAVYTANQSGNFPHGLLRIGVDFAGAPTGGTTIDVFVRARNIHNNGGTDYHAPEPSTTNFHRYAGSFHIAPVTTLQFHEILVRNLPPVCSFYFYNNETGQAVTPLWFARIVPLTRGLATS